MEAYTNFASVYDTFMSDIPYEAWHRYLHGLFEEYGILAGTVLDMGCGTGTVTELMSAQGYDMIGLDSSEDMLAIAMEKKLRSGHDILYLLQDMRELELYSSVRAVYSICDSLNYITEPEELGQVFELVGRYLDADGVFIFDCKTDYFYRELIGDRTIAENREDCSFIWDNYYYEDEQLNEYELSLFIKDTELSGKASEAGKPGEIFRRFQETHFQRGYTLEELRGLLQSAGLRCLAAYDAFSREAPKKDSERIYIIAGKGEE